MTKIINSRGTGKTKQLILEAEKTGGVIVCSNADAMMTKIHAVGASGVRAVNYYTFLNGEMPKAENMPIFYIDEVEGLLAAAAGGQYKAIGGFTVCKEND